MVLRYNPDNRRLPQSVAEGLRVLRLWAGFKSQQALVSDAKARDRREFPHVSFTHDTVRDLEKWQRPLRYAHLEIYEGSTGIPTGVLLAITHTVSLLRDGKADAARAYADGLEAVIKRVRAITKEPEMREPGVLLSRERREEVIAELLDAYFEAGFNAEAPFLPRTKKPPT
jgi:hypothetical protein